MILQAVRCARPILLFEQPIFVSVDYICIGKVRFVLMMELASLVFLWPKLFTIMVEFIITFNFDYFGLDHNDD